MLFGIDALGVGTVVDAGIIASVDGMGAGTAAVVAGTLVTLGVLGVAAAFVLLDDVVLLDAEEAIDCLVDFDVVGVDVSVMLMSSIEEGGTVCVSAFGSSELCVM